MPEIGQSRIPGQLLKTGQQTQYGGYQDDGYFQKGLARRYTIRDKGKYAGTVDITINAKTEPHSNNCVYDHRTKLLWSRYRPIILGPADNGTLPWTTNGSGEGIFAYCAAANIAKVAGFSDWRIPNDTELHSLITQKAPNAYPDATAFPDWQGAYYPWSSTTTPSSTIRAHCLHQDTGIMTSDDKTANRRLILVRG